MTRPDSWQDILDPGETILWQGRPDPRPHWAALSLHRAASGLVVTLIALFWIGVASRITSEGDFPAPFHLFPLFGLPFLAVGLYQLAGHVLWEAYRRAHTWYTLSDRRAFIATDMPLRGKSLRSYPITPDTILTFDDSDLASIGFAFEPVPMKRTTRMRGVGFERIADGRTVYALLRGVQASAARSSQGAHPE